MESVFSHQTIGKCLYSTSLVIKQTDSIALATSGNLNVTHMINSAVFPFQCCMEILILLFV